MITLSRQIGANLARARLELACRATVLYAPSQQIEEWSSASDADLIRSAIASTMDSLLELCGKENRPIVSNRVRHGADGPLLGKFVAAPLEDNDGERGILVAYNAAGGSAFNGSHAQLTMQFAREIAAVLSTSRDPLTGLLTRAAFEDRVTRMRASHVGMFGAMLYGDLDEMHAINGQWGFSTGDRAITLAGECLRRALGVQRVLTCRLSGDRFTAFVPSCSLAHAKDVAEQARGAVQQLQFDSNGRAIPLSICWGVATLAPSEGNLDHAWAAAEIACKMAKDKGRNRVETYNDRDTSTSGSYDCIAEGVSFVTAPSAAQLSGLAIA